MFVITFMMALWFIPHEVRDRLLYTFNARPEADIKPVVVFGIQLDPSASARLWDWKKAFEIWMKHPFFGYGLAGKSFLDSQYINNLIEGGAFGFLTFAGLIWTLQRQVLRVYRTSIDPVVRGLALGFLAGNIGMLFHALTVNTFILIRIMEPYWFLAGMIIVSPRIFVAPAQPGISSVKKPAVEEKSFRRNTGLFLGRGLPRGGTNAI